jgi:hypothetical protein
MTCNPKKCGCRPRPTWPRKSHSKPRQKKSRTEERRLSRQSARWAPKAKADSTAAPGAGAVPRPRPQQKGHGHRTLASGVSFCPRQHEARAGAGLPSGGPAKRPRAPGWPRTCPGQVGLHPSCFICAGLCLRINHCPLVGMADLPGSHCALVLVLRASMMIHNGFTETLSLSLSSPFSMHHTISLLSNSYRQS